MRSPLASMESWVGWPRVVAGTAARILSMVTDMAAWEVVKGVSRGGGWEVCRNVDIRFVFGTERVEVGYSMSLWLAPFLWRG